MNIYFGINTIDTLVMLVCESSMMQTFHKLKLKKAFLVISSMSKSLRHNFSFILILSLLFSSVGYSVTSFACPMMRNVKTLCSECDMTPSEAQKDCCKPKTEHRVVKAEFEKPHEFKTDILLLAKFPASTISLAFANSLNSHAATHALLFLPASSLHSMEKCALLSTFII